MRYKPRTLAALLVAVVWSPILVWGSEVPLGESGGIYTVPVQVNPSGLGPGTYMGQISVMSSGAVNSPQTVPVTLLVSTQPILSFENSGTTFTYQLTVFGGTQTLPPAQTVNITSSGNPLPITVTTTPVVTVRATCSVAASAAPAEMPTSSPDWRARRRTDRCASSVLTRRTPQSRCCRKMVPSRRRPASRSSRSCGSTGV